MSGFSGPPTVLCIGTLVLDHLIYPEGRALENRLGGNAALFSAAFVRSSSFPLKFVGQVGDDEAGRWLRAALQQRGVDTASLGLHCGATKICHLQVAADGGWQQEYTNQPVYPYLPSPDPALLVGASHLQVMGLNSLLRSCPRHLHGWVETARCQGLALGMGLNLPGSEGRGAVVDLLQPEDVVFCNRDEAAWWLEAPPSLPALTSALHACPQHDVVVTLGADGALVKQRGGAPMHLPGRPVFARSTVGAGDHLCAFTTAGVLDGLPLVQAVAMAQPLVADFLMSSMV